jgi:hypothetical protein
VVVDDFDFVSATVAPTEADAPLVVDANAVLPLAIALQCFEVIARRHTQILKGSRAANPLSRSP